MCRKGLTVLERNQLIGGGMQHFSQKVLWLWTTVGNTTVKSSPQVFSLREYLQETCIPCFVFSEIKDMSKAESGERTGTIMHQQLSASRSLLCVESGAHVLFASILWTDKTYMYDVFMCPVSRLNPNGRVPIICWTGNCVEEQIRVFLQSKKVCLKMFFFY